MTGPRKQRVFVIQRHADGHFCTDLKTQMWAEDVAEAAFLARSKYTGIVRAEWGRNLDDYRLCEVVPVLLETV